MGRDVVKDAMSALLTGLNEELDKDGWDRPPTLWAVHREMGDNALGLVATVVGTGDMLTRHHPSDGLHQLALAARRGVRPPLPGPVFAMVLVSESWMVLPADVDPAVLQDAADRRLHTRTDRIEVRTLAAVDVAGIRYTYLAPRDPGAMPPLSTAGSPGDPLYMDGYVHESLATLVEALC